MKTALSRILRPLLVIATTGLAAAAVAADAKVKIEDKYATVNGVKLHYLTAGQGEPVILLHGYAQNSHMWRPLMAELGKTRLVIAPDLRGFGDSASPRAATTRSRWRRTSMRSPNRSASGRRAWPDTTSA